MKVLHFGAGALSRGLIANIFVQSGLYVTFADTDTAKIERINIQRNYKVRIAGEASHTEVVDNIEAVHIKDYYKLLYHIKLAGLITVTVGEEHLLSLADTLANGLKARFVEGNKQPLNIILCEKMLDAPEILKKEVYNRVGAAYQILLDRYVSFVGSIADRVIVPNGQDEKTMLDLLVEDYYEWLVDGSKLILENLPPIAGIQLVDNLAPYMERKIFTLYTGHMVLGLLGNLKGLTYIQEAMAIPEIYNQVKATMQETGAVLLKRYEFFDEETHNHYIDTILKRFTNTEMLDKISAVILHPIKKLQKDERLVKPLLQSLELGTESTNLIKAVALTLKLKNAEDPQAVELAEFIEQQGVEQAIRKYTGIENTTLIAKITQEFNAL